MLSDKLEDVYEKYGKTAIYPPLFIFFFLLHFISSLGMYYPVTDPNELGVIAVGEWFTGSNWSGVMSSVNYYYGFMQGLLYTPALILFNDPQTCYIAMLTTNAVIMSFIPLIAFSCAQRLGAGKVWKELLIAFVSGAYCCYFAHAKFAWSETAAIIFTWIILWLLLRSFEVRKKGKRIFCAVVLGLCCALALGAHNRLISVVFAVIIALIAQKIFCRRSAVPIVPFLISLIVFGAGVSLLSSVIMRSLWDCGDPSALNNTTASFFSNIAAGFADENGAGRFFITLFGQLYYLVTATWGVGAVAFCLFGVVLLRSVQKRKAGEEQSFSENTIGFAFFVFFSVFFTLMIGTLYRFGNENITEYQDTTLFGRFLDGVIPLMLMFVLITLFTLSIELNKLLTAGAILGVIYTAFFSFTAPIILSCPATRISPILALYPLQIGRESNSALTLESLLLTASMTFCVMSLFVVIVSCTKKYRSLLISLVLVGLSAYSVIFIQKEYLPLCRAESVQKNAAVVKISESVYNQNGAPPLTAYDMSRHEALMLQYLNRNITVGVTYDIEAIPENCYLAVKSTEDVSALSGGRSPFILMSERSGIRLYAYGERAIAYMQSQDIDELAEDEDDSAGTEAAGAESETASAETTTSPTASSAATTARTSRTTTTPASTAPILETIPADALDTDDDWAEIS